MGIYNPGDLSVPNVDQLNTDAGLRNIVSQGQSPRYTAGQAAFDQAALEKSPDFINQVQGLKKQAGDLQNNIATTTAQTQQQAQTDAAAKLAAAQASTKNYLLAERGGLTSSIQGKADAANTSLQGLDLNSILQGSLNQATPDIQGIAEQKFGGLRVDPQFQQALANLKGNLNPADYVTPHAAYTAQDFVNPDQATTWNQINGLLGDQTPNYLAGAGQGDQYTVNKDALTNKLINDTQVLRGQADVSSQKDLQSILDNANGLATGVNANSKDIGKYLAPTLTQYGNDLVNSTPEYKPYWQTQSLTGQPSSTDHLDLFNQYLQQLKTPVQLPQVQGNDLLTGDQASQLNKDASDLGQPANYQAGQYAAGVSPQSFINKDDFTKWLTGMLANQETGRVATGKEGPPVRAVYNSGTGGSGLSTPSNTAGPFNAILQNQGAVPTAGTFDSLNPAIGQSAIVDPNAIHRYGPSAQAINNQSIGASSSPNDFTPNDPNIVGTPGAANAPTTAHDQWGQIGQLLQNNSWVNPVLIPTAGKAINTIRTGKF